MTADMNEIVIFGGARDYHAIDWYRVVRKIVPNRDVIFLTDMIDSEGFKNIVEPDDEIERLFIIDRLLFPYQSRLGNIWRNIVKLAVLPIQILYLRKFVTQHPECIIHAHPMYYMLVCWAARIDYIGTPQGSEILVRPVESLIYKYILVKLLKAASSITVDSVKMSNKIYSISDVRAILIQNGVDIKEIKKIDIKRERKNNILSIRGMTHLYQITQLLTARNLSEKNPSLSFVFPFSDYDYINSVKKGLREADKLIGRLDKDSLYQLLARTKLVISIPSIDSSPRSL